MTVPRQRMKSGIRIRNMFCHRGKHSQIVNPTVSLDATQQIMADKCWLKPGVFRVCSREDGNAPLIEVGKDAFLVDKSFIEHLWIAFSGEVETSTNRLGGQSGIQAGRARTGCNCDGISLSTAPALLARLCLVFISCKFLCLAVRMSRRTPETRKSKPAQSAPRTSKQDSGQAVTVG